MDTEAGDFPDWEVLTDPEDSVIVNSPNSADNFRDLGVIERDDSSAGVIRFDYFSLDSHANYSVEVTEVDVGDDLSSVESDNPSWIDPGLERETCYVNKEVGEFGTDLGSDRSDDRKVEEFVGDNDLGVAEMATEGQIGGESDNSDRFLLDSGGRVECNGDVLEEGGSEFSSEEKVVGDLKEEKTIGESENVVIGEMKSCSDEGKRSMVWWKLPLDLLKYCLFKVNPVWTISMAAAMMGFVILGRRLYQMKRKTRSLQLKVTVDDKKVSQFMTRAARLNEAFSVVKRVPVIRPSLPAGGVSPWPMMSLR